MFWAEPPTTIEYYTIKKQMEAIPELKNTSLFNLSQNQKNMFK